MTWCSGFALNYSSKRREQRKKKQTDKPRRLLNSLTLRYITFLFYSKRITHQPSSAPTSSALSVEIFQSKGRGDKEGTVSFKVPGPFRARGMVGKTNICILILSLSPNAPQGRGSSFRLQQHWCTRGEIAPPNTYPAGHVVGTHRESGKLGHSSLWEVLLLSP